VSGDCARVGAGGGGDGGLSGRFALLVDNNGRFALARKRTLELA